MNINSSTIGVILAAGKGTRLGHLGRIQPKCLMNIGNKTILERQMEILLSHNINRILIGVGYQSEKIITRIRSVFNFLNVDFIINDNYEKGNIVTLKEIFKQVNEDDRVLLLDADLIFHKNILTLLLNSKHKSCLLVDNKSYLDEEAVKVSAVNGKISGIGKQMESKDSIIGESIGIYKLSNEMTGMLMKILKNIDIFEHQNLEYEFLLNEILSRQNDIGYELTNGIPWIEIDFPQDVKRYYQEILPVIDL